MDRPSKLVMLPENIPDSILEQFNLDRESVKSLNKFSKTYLRLESAVLSHHIFGKNNMNQ